MLEVRESQLRHSAPVDGGIVHDERALDAHVAADGAQVAELQRTNEARRHAQVSADLRDRLQRLRIGCARDDDRAFNYASSRRVLARTSFTIRFPCRTAASAARSFLVRSALERGLSTAFDFLATASARDRQSRAR